MFVTIVFWKEESTEKPHCLILHKCFFLLKLRFMQAFPWGVKFVCFKDVYHQTDSSSTDMTKTILFVNGLGGDLEQEEEERLYLWGKETSWNIELSGRNCLYISCSICSLFLSGNVHCLQSSPKDEISASTLADIHSILTWLHEEWSTFFMRRLPSVMLEK